MDLALTVPAAWYWLVVRPGLRSKVTLVFVAFLGLWRAAFLFPDVVPGKIWIGGGLELAIVVAVVTGLRGHRGSSGMEDADPVDRLRHAVARITPSSVAAKAMASEFLIFYYAFAWKPKPHVPPGMKAFSLHERSATNVLMGCMALVSLLEIVPVHVVLASRWSATAAWIATGLSLWGAVWILALGRSFALRPTLAGPDSITVRYGLLFRLRIPVDRIRSIESAGSLPAGSKTIPKGTPASVCIHLKEPLEAELLLGFTKRVTAIGLSADDATGFARALAHLSAHVSAHVSGRISKD